jgi:signal peptidase I
MSPDESGTRSEDETNNAPTSEQSSTASSTDVSTDPDVTTSTSTSDTEATTVQETTDGKSEPIKIDSSKPPAEGKTTAMPAASATTTATKKPIKVKKKRSFLSKVTEVPILILLAFGIAILIKTFLVQAFFIPSGSMIPTLHVGDRVLVEKVGYVFGGPDRNDVVVFEKNVFGVSKDLPWTTDARNFFRELLGLPTGDTEDYIKRVVAIGGDKISYQGRPRVLLVNGEKAKQDFVKGGVDNSSPTLTKSDCKRLEMDVSGEGCRVPAGKVFVMGDNRSNSEDSRILGPIDEDKIVGKAFLIIWPPGDFGTL